MSTLKGIPAVPPVASPEFDRELESERSRWLRRRFVLFCAVLLLLDLISTTFELFDELGQLRPASLQLAWDLGFGALSIVVALAALVYACRRSVPPRRLVTVSLWLAAAGGVLTSIWARGSLALDPSPEADHLGTTDGLPFSVLFHHLIPCLLLPWTRRESAVVGGVLKAAAAAVVGFDAAATGRSGWQPAVWAVGWSAVAVLPGLLFCWFRYTRFRRAFAARFEAALYRRLHGELVSARQVHETCLPPPRVIAGPVRVAYAYEPMREIGGDLLFVHPRGDGTGGGPESMPVAGLTPRPASVVLIDVCGHGIAAALAVNRLAGELERLFDELADPTPAAVLRGLNRYVGRSLARHSMYATAVCLRVDPVLGLVEYASGGHPPVLLRRGGDAAVSKQIDRLDSTAPMLGVFDDAEYDPDQRQAPLAAGDVLVAYTDGTTEACNPAGHDLGIPGLERMVGVIAAGHPDPLDWPAAVLAAVRDHRRAAAADDTLAVTIALEPAGVATRPTQLATRETSAAV